MQGRAKNEPTEAPGMSKGARRKRGKRAQGPSAEDAEFGVSRGVDFCDVPDAALTRTRTRTLTRTLTLTLTRTPTRTLTRTLTRTRTRTLTRTRTRTLTRTPTLTLTPGP